MEVIRVFLLYLLIVFLGGCHVGWLSAEDDGCSELEIKYDDQCDSLGVVVSTDSWNQHLIDRIVDSYPNLVNLSMDVGSPYDVPRDDLAVNCSRILDLKKLSFLRVFVSGRLLQVERLLGTLQHNDCYHQIHAQRGCIFQEGMGFLSHMPPLVDESESEFYCSKNHSSCRYETDEFEIVYCRGWGRQASFSRTVFDSESQLADEDISLSKLPRSCNLLELSGNFDLTHVGVSPWIEMISWVGLEKGHGQALSWITPERFPNLKCLRLIWESDQPQEIDVAGLNRMKSLEFIELELIRIKPIGLESLDENRQFRGVDYLIVGGRGFNATEE